MNPYEKYKTKTGERCQPYDIAEMYCLPAPAFEFVKKILCAGIEGRAKDKKHDLQDAIDTLKICNERSSKFLRIKYCFISAKVISIELHINAIKTTTIFPDEIAGIYELKGAQLAAFNCFFDWVFSDYTDGKAYRSCLVNLEMLVAVL